MDPLHVGGQKDHETVYTSGSCAVMSPVTKNSDRLVTEPLRQLAITWVNPEVRPRASHRVFHGTDVRNHSSRLMNTLDFTSVQDIRSNGPFSRLEVLQRRKAAARLRLPCDSR